MFPDMEFYNTLPEKLSYVMYLLYGLFILLTVYMIVHSYFKNKKSLPSVIGLLAIGHVGALYVMDFDDITNINFSVMLETYKNVFYLLFFISIIAVILTAIFYSTGRVKNKKN